MKKMILGRTGLEVTELCFGALPMGPLQKNLSAQDFAGLVARALELGVSFVDTAQMYRTYEPIKLAIERTGIRPVIASKSAAESYEDMEQAINQARPGLGVDYLDIMLLHAARVSAGVFKEREGAFRCLLDYREKGIVKNIGISAHGVDVIRLAADNDEIDVVFPILNKAGMGILRGGVKDMESAINYAHGKGKGIYLMKALAGGNLISDYVNSMEYVRGFSAGRFPIALGMVAPGEVEMNYRYFNGEDVSEELAGLKDNKKAVSVFRNLCRACGKCMETCHSEAISYTDGKAYVDPAKCLTCGYCVQACPEFAIRVI